MFQEHLSAYIAIYKNPEIALIRLSQDIRKKQQQLIPLVLRDINRHDNDG